MLRAFHRDVLVLQPLVGFFQEYAASWSVSATERLKRRNRAYRLSLPGAGSPGWSGDWAVRPRAARRVAVNAVPLRYEMNWRRSRAFSMGGI